MADPRDLLPGTRVRLSSSSHAITLRSSDGYVIRPDEWADYFIVRLDRPAKYHHADGRIEDLREIRELADNLEVIKVEAHSVA